MIDELGYDLVDLPGVSVEETVFEPLSRETYPESVAGAGLGDGVGDDGSGPRRAEPCGRPAAPGGA